MSNLSGYDGEAVGFDSVTLNKRSERDASAQTTEFSESGVASQTHLQAECGSTATPEDLNAQDDILREYPPPGLNEFLRKIVPAVLEQLDQNDKEIRHDSSDSEEEEVITAKLVQEIKLADLPSNGAGDESHCVLDISWSSAGNSFAVSIGRSQHENLCTHDGLIRIFTMKRTAGDTYVRNLDVTEKSCISVVKYHHSASALLAYGTTSGEVVVCDLRSLDAVIMSSPSGCHGSKRVSAIHWADAALANTFLTMHIVNTGKRRGAADHVLISAGSNGSINIWQVNINSKTFESIITYTPNGSRKLPALDISCFDFIKPCPLQPSEDKLPDDIFVVGTKSGELLLCKAKAYELITDSLAVDPVYEALDGHRTCLLDVAFSFQKPGIFVSASIDSELRVYDVRQNAPLKVLCVDLPISSVSWLPLNPSVAVLGLARAGPQGQALALYDTRSGRTLPVGGLAGGNCVTTLCVLQSGTCRVAAGDAEGAVRVWELPVRRLRVNEQY